MSSVASLWESLCRLLTSSVQSLSEIVWQFQQFSLLHENLSQWLTTIESSVSRDLEESFLSIPDDQGDTVFQVGDVLMVILVPGSSLLLKASINAGGRDEFMQLVSQRDQSF